MDKIIYNIQTQIAYTAQLLQNFFKDINLSTLLSAVAVLYVIFLRKWGFSRILSFVSTMFLLLLMLVRVEAYLTTTFGAEDSQISIGVSRTLFFVLTAIILIYNTAVKD